MTGRLLRSRALPLLLVLAIAGCGPTTFSAGMQRILSNILFGQPAPKKTPAPLPPPPPAALPPIPIAPPPVVARQNPCPSAPVGSPALRPIDVNVSAPAQNGTYKWLAYSQIRGTAGNSGVRSEFEQHYIEQAKQEADFPANPLQGQPDHHFTFTEVLPDMEVPGYTDIVSYAVQTYSPVNYNAIAFQDNFDPNGGVDITEIQRLDAAGNQVEDFNPVKNGNGEGVLIFALPLPAGNGGNSGLPTPDAPDPDHFSWEYATSDPVSQWTIQIAASELNKQERVDACGQIVDAWPVEAKLFITKKDPATGLPYPNQLEQDWKYWVAPQYGGMIVKQSLSGDIGNGGTIDFFDQLASLDIAPLPRTEGST